MNPPRTLRRRLINIGAVFGLFFAALLIVSPHLILGGSQGAPCAENEDCRSGLCLSAGELGYCSIRCDADSDCDSGLHCTSLQGERVCLKRIGFGEACIAEAECRGGLCVARATDADANAGFCSQPCDSERPCPENARCEPSAIGAQVCVPASGVELK